MKILKDKYFWIMLSAIALITLIILWLKQYFCENGQYPWENKNLPAISTGKCSFWTGKPILIRGNADINPNPVPAGNISYKYDAVEKKCFRVDNEGQSWVSNEECTSRGISIT